MPFDWKTRLETLKKKKFQIASVVLAVVTVGLGIVLWLSFGSWATLNLEHQALREMHQTTQADLEILRATDQVARNDQLEAEIESIQKIFADAIGRYEEIVKLKDEGVKTPQLDTAFAKIITDLSRREYATAAAQLTQLDNAISTEQVKRAVAVPIPANVPVINEAPAAGGSRQQSVETEIGTFLVDVIAADLNSTRVVVETASEGDCADGCPVDSLASFVSRAGGFAGINGPYFCPAEYPSCAGKTNSFDTLIMNRNKTYFNSDNNVYSTVPAVIFSGNSARFVGASSQWGRDTSPDSVIASQPMVLSGGNVVFGGDGDPKKGSRGNRSFIGVKDNTVYIGVVRGATVAEVGYVLKAMGLQNGLNLDSGGSTALYNNGRYLAGPGRNTPFGIVLVRR